MGLREEIKAFNYIAPIVIGRYAANMYPCMFTFILNYLVTLTAIILAIITFFRRNKTMNQTEIPKRIKWLFYAVYAVILACCFIYPFILNTTIPMGRTYMLISFFLLVVAYAIFISIQLCQMKKHHNYRG